MFKKKPKLGNLFVYTIYDNVSKKYRGLFYHYSDEDMIRTSLPTVLMDFPLRDINIYRIGTFDDDSGELLPSHRVLIPTSCYTFPHSRLSSDGDDLPLDDLDNEMKKAKNEMVANLSDTKNKKEVANG